MAMKGLASLQNRSRVEDWRADFRLRWVFHNFRSGPQSGCHHHVSSPRVLRSPSARQIADATEVEAQEPKALTSGQVDGSALLLVNLHV